MAAGSFVAVQCPACGSNDVVPEGSKGYRCDHCESFFVRGKEASVAEPQVVRSRPGSSRGCMLPLLVGIVAVAAGIVVLATSGGADEAEGGQAAAASPAESSPKPVPRPDPTPRIEVEPQPEPTPEPALSSEAPEVEAEPEPEPIVLAAYQPLEGCTCKADLDGDGRSETVQLAMKAAAVGTWITSNGTFREYALELIVRSGQREPQRLPLDADTAPPRRRRGDSLLLGIACEADHLLLAADDRVSSFSLRSQQVEWTTTLPAPYTPKRPLTAAEGLSLRCDRLPLKKGRVSVRLPGGTVDVAAADGALP